MSGSGMTAGVLTVNYDGTYSAVPALGPFGVPGTATSIAQARFEARFPILIAKMPAATQAQVIDATTSPPTTNKGSVMQGLAAEINAEAAADVGYMQANAVATIAGSTNLEIVVPTPNTSGTAIGATSAPIVLPIS